MKDIYFVSFYTKGDGCFDLSSIVDKIKMELTPHFKKMFFYNKEDLKKLPNSEDICNYYQEPLDLTYFPNAHKIGYLDWKPFIIKHTLKQIPENSILLYHDVNFEKYQNYWQSDWEKIYEFCDSMMVENESDFWMKFELFDYYLKKSAKTYTIDTLFEDLEQREIVKNSLQLNAGQIIMRNTEKTRTFIDEWLELCRDKTLIGPIPNPNRHADSEIIGCGDQDPMNCLIYKYIFEGKLKPTFPKYGLHYRVLRRDKIHFMMNDLHCETGPYELINHELINYLKNK
jgi:hypothetical protein